jgi:predicted TIM-barrel fold metal-dependent hydrolase
MMIDGHIHVLAEGFWPTRWFDWVSHSWAAGAPDRDPAVIRPKIEPGLLDPDGSQMIADMDAAGVDKAVIMTVDWGPDLADRVSLHDLHTYTSDLVGRYPDRLVPFAGIDPRRPEAADVLEWAIRDLGFKGLKLYPPAGFYPYDRAAFPLYEICAARGVPVAFHTGEALAITPSRWANPLFIQDIHSSFPTLPVWLCHAGARIWWDEALSTAAHGIGTSLELSCWIWDDLDDALEERFVRHLDEARNKIGIGKLIFGSDHVSGRRVRGREFMPMVVNWFRDLPTIARKYGVSFSDDEVEAMMGANAARSLGLEA